MELAVEGAREMNHTYIGTEHLLPGIIRADTSQASSTLEHAGADYAAVRKAVDEVLNGKSRRERGETPSTRQRSWLNRASILEPVYDLCNMLS